MKHVLFIGVAGMLVAVSLGFMQVKQVTRKVLVAAEMQEGDGANVKRLFPTGNFRHQDPFVLIDEFFVTPPAGFPPHPHRGFEAITYMIDGAFRHEDNLGNASTVASGGAQRFTAGKGIVHSEMPGKVGTAHGLQLWINLPQRLKKMDPGYQQVNAKDFPVEKVGNVEIKHVVGGSSPLRLNTLVVYQDISMGSNSNHSITLQPGFTGFLYVLRGSLSVDAQQVSASQAVLLDVTDKFIVSTKTGGRFVLISGLPHDEPIRQRGPYVD